MLHLLLLAWIILMVCMLSKLMISITSSTERIKIPLLLRLILTLGCILILILLLGTLIRWLIRILILWILISRAWSLCGPIIVISLISGLLRISLIPLIGIIGVISSRIGWPIINSVGLVRPLWSWREWRKRWLW